MTLSKLSKGMKQLDRLPVGSTIELIGDNLILTKKQRGDTYRWVKDNRYLPVNYIVERGYRIIDQESKNIYISNRMSEYNKQGILTIENVLTLLNKTKEEANTMFYID